MRRWIAATAIAVCSGMLGFGVANAATGTSTPEQDLAAAALAYAQSQGWTPPSPAPTSSPTPSPTATPTPSPTATPTPTPTPSPTPTSGACPVAGKNKPGAADPWGGCFPGDANTGAHGTLTAYSGALTGTLTNVKLSGDLAVSGNLTLINSEIDGTIRTTGSGTLHLTDVTINGGNPAFDSGETFIDLYGANITALRINLFGGNGGFSCTGNCSVTDSWLHDPYIVAAKHYDSVGSNGVDGFTITHNSVWCNNHAQAPGATGGCTADAGFFADFGPIVHVSGSRNLFVASNDSAGYCLNGGIGGTKPYAGTSGNDSWTNNVFQKGANGRCGQYGPVDYWTTTSQNIWSGNTWDDGTPLNE